MHKLLLLEDDVLLLEGITAALSAPDRQITACRTAAQALEVLPGKSWSLLLLDINLPDGSGLDLLRRMRSGGSRVPVILLTANDLELDEVTGLEAGADDYITKPFSLAVLRARVAAQLRRDGPREEPPVLELGPFLFDFRGMEFRRDGTAIDLSKTEQKLLRTLVENRGRTVPRALLIDRIWTGGAEYVEENALSVTVKRLRSKLEQDPARPEFLKTVYGIGYTWAVKP